MLRILLNLALLVLPTVYIWLEERLSEELRVRATKTKVVEVLS